MFRIGASPDKGYSRKTGGRWGGGGKLTFMRNLPENLLCLPKIPIIPFKMSSILSLMWLPIC